jgi:hypothetical protein
MRAATKARRPPRLHSAARLQPRASDVEFRLVRTRKSSRDGARILSPGFYEARCGEFSVRPSYAGRSLPWLLRPADDAAADHDDRQFRSQPRRPVEAYPGLRADRFQPSTIRASPSGCAISPTGDMPPGAIRLIPIRYSRVRRAPARSRRSSNSDSGRSALRPDSNAGFDPAMGPVYGILVTQRPTDLWFDAAENRAGVDP